MSKSNNKQIIGACPLDCPDACSWVVDVKDGQAVKLRGNKAHPFTQGTLCVKVNPYIKYSALPDRLLYPMKRIGVKGSGQFQRISWDDALSTIAANLEKTIDTYGGEAILPYSGTGTMGFLQGANGAGKRLFNVLGASHHDGTICSVSGHVGMSYTTGSAAGMNPEDLVHSGVIILWGTNTLVSNRHLWPFIKKGKDNGAMLVVIDPVKTKTAQRADLHIAPRPGTDGALALGIMQRLVELNAAEEAYLNGRTKGWPAFKQQVLPNYTLDKVAEICDLPAESIENLAQLIATKKPMGIRLSMGMQRHLGGGQAARVISCLPAVTGDYERLGGGLCYSTGPAYKFNLGALWGTHLQKQPVRSLAMTRLGTNLLDLNDPPVKSLILWAANPVISNPDSHRIRQGLSREDLFTVVIENFQTDTADYADILLPSTMQLEHADFHDSFSHLYVNWNNTAVSPPGECLSHTEIFRRLAKTMKLKEPELFATDDEIAQAALDSDHPAMDGISLEYLKEHGWAKLKWPEPFHPFKESFFTSSGKFEFESERAEKDGYGRFPHFTPPAETMRKDNGSLSLVSPANNFLLNSMFANSPYHQKSGKPMVIVHPKDAEKMNLHDGHMVCVRNDRGSFEAVCKVGDQARKGTAVTTKGLWAKHHSGNNVNNTTIERDSDMGRGAVYHDNRVWIEPLK